MTEQDLELALHDLAVVHVRHGAPADVREDARLIPLTTPQQRYGLPPFNRWFQSTFSATKFVVAGAIVALFGGFLLVTQPFDRVAVTVPGAETEGLPPVTGPAANGLIVFVQDGDIYVGDPATGRTEGIVPGAEGRGPRFSPDGTHIAFLRNIIPGPHGPCDIFVVRADGSDERDITPDANGVSCGFSWAPDSRSLVVEQNLEPFYPMLLLDASGVADPVPLPIDTPVWTDATFLRPPDGDRLLMWGGRVALGLIDLDGGDFVDLAESSGLWWMGYDAFDDAGWSPDGSRIAVLAKAGHERHLYVMDADGGQLRRLAAIPWHEGWGGPPWSWSPDGSTIAAQYATLVEPSSRDSCYDAAASLDHCGEAMWITLIDVESGEKRALDTTHSPYEGDGAIWAWSWSPDGQTIVLMREFDSYGLRARPELVDIETDTSVELPWEPDGFPSWQRVAAD